MIASSVTDSAVECGATGPVGQSAVMSRFFHVATAFGSMLWRSVKALRLACQLCIARYSASGVVRSHGERGP